MVEVKRTVRITTTQHVLSDIAPVQEGFPMRGWSIEICLVDDKGSEVPATLFDKVTYHLHPTFVNPVRSFKKPPFRIEEKGWGGFDIPIVLTLVDKGGDKKLNHDLNFMKEKYVVDQVISINTTKPQLLKELLNSGPVPNFNAEGETSTVAAKRKGNNNVADAKTVKRMKSGASKGGVDLEKMADYLSKLNEDDLLGVVQMVNDNRTSEMNIKNDVENGEFTMDLYTLPDTLLKSLWDYVKKRAE
ncbi:DEKNAAC101628 [Brettanomyces naardenensis]|uniref:DEKNAAC101628 n=1 Tax=Brettanomyces naardenensis TaxID=13370 RepID=A0A448YII6_BRENA|nr:DEKNAAC101628 [Brettanomyces naardenensis]